MTEATMPAIEVQDSDTAEDVADYECAFHILPTIADEEVPGVVEGLKTLVMRLGGTITNAEAPERYDLAYDITKQVDGVNRRFNAAHFGWIRFVLAPRALPACIEEIKQKPEILRHLIIRLTRAEARMPFSIFEARRTEDRMKDKSDAEVATRRKEARGEDDGTVSDELLDQSLEKLTTQ